MIKLDFTKIKGWQIFIVALFFFAIIYILNINVKPYKFVGLNNNKTYQDEIFKSNKYSNLYKTLNKTFKCEELCRNTLEEIYKVPFPKVRPDWLKNPETGRNLELDCYNEDLGLALEYNGSQHYSENSVWNADYNQFTKQKERDELKMKLCKDNNIKLIVVPYTISPDNIPEFIKNELIRGTIPNDN